MRLVKEYDDVSTYCDIFKCDECPRFGDDCGGNWDILVECSECRFCKLEGDDEEGTHYLWCWKHDTDVNETDFCSYGEREGE